MVEAELFRALGDPTRIEIIRRLSSRDAYTISMLAHGLPITRQAVRKHIQLLANANVITLEPRGRDTNVRLQRDALEQAKAFIASLEQQWDDRLMALKHYVDGA